MPTTATATGTDYTFSWSRDDDGFRLRDKQDRVVLSGTMQPAVVVRRPGAAGTTWSLGHVEEVSETGSGLVVTYGAVNGSGSLTVRWSFGADRIRLDPVTYQQSDDAAVVALHYFGRTPAEPGGLPDPGLSCRFLVHPGVNGSGVLSPVIPMLANLDTLTWLGRGGPSSIGPDRGLMRQQWGLPSHYVAGVDSAVHSVQPGALTRHRSDAFCLGLARLPAGDAMLRMRQGRFAPVVQYHGDLWGHLTGPGTYELGAPMVLVPGDGYRDAIRRYLGDVGSSGAIDARPWSAEKVARATASQFNTWGAQLAAGQALAAFDETGLRAIFDQLRASGLEPEMFVVDDKWEGRYGLLEHDTERFPAFDDTLRHIRDAGHRVGLWAAFLRCDDPGAVGLTPQHMLRGPDGAPVKLTSPDEDYFLYDVTRPEVRDVVRSRVAGFVERYRPHLVKFDFGYEIPALSRCAPADMSHAGERLLRFALDVVVGALRAADPDIVVMYNSLSPLLAGHVDVHGTDDMWMNAQEFHLEANRRLFFSSLLGELGVPTYGSAGYDWTAISDIWFDSAVTGSLGSLGSFTGDLSDSRLTPRLVAKFNGLRRLTRRTRTFTVDPVVAPSLGPVTGARSSSWIRLEDGVVTAVALRTAGFAGAPGADRVEGVVRTTADLVLASLGETAGVTTASRLGLVPYGDGDVELVRPGPPAEVSVYEHLLDGRRVESVVRVTDGRLRVRIREHVDACPVTWVELAASPSCP